MVLGRFREVQGCSERFREVWGGLGWFRMVWSSSGRSQAAFRVFGDGKNGFYLRDQLLNFGSVQSMNSCSVADKGIGEAPKDAVLYCIVNGGLVVVGASVHSFFWFLGPAQFRD